MKERFIKYPDESEICKISCKCVRTIQFGRIKPERVFTFYFDILNLKKMEN